MPMSPDNTTTLVVFDAMGVLYSVGDDESELLIPYLRELGCVLGDAQIRRLYREASVGMMTSAQFWRECRVMGDEEEYCSRHALTPGMEDLLADLHGEGVSLGCLSNDVSEWSRLLRERFGLEAWIQTWAISGDLRVRKPDPAAFRALVGLSGVPLDHMIFFDDNDTNVEAALRCGMDAIRFTSVTQARQVLRERGLA